MAFRYVVSLKTRHFSIVSKLSYGAGWRTEKKDPFLSCNTEGCLMANSDDASNHFSRGLVTNTLKFYSAMSYRHKPLEGTDSMQLGFDASIQKYWFH